MSFKSYAVHYKNKFGGRVDFGDDHLDVFSKKGEHLIALKKNGAGQIVDRSEEFGLSEKHDLAPIEKKFRAHKLHADGRIGQAEEYDERIEECKKAWANEGKVHSEHEWAAKKLAEKKAAKA